MTSQGHIYNLWVVNWKPWCFYSLHSPLNLKKKLYCFDNRGKERERKRRELQSTGSLSEYAQGSSWTKPKPVAQKSFSESPQRGSQGFIHVSHKLLPSSMCITTGAEPGVEQRPEPRHSDIRGIHLWTCLTRLINHHLQPILYLFLEHAVTFFLIFINISLNYQNWIKSSDS